MNKKKNMTIDGWNADIGLAYRKHKYYGKLWCVRIDIPFGNKKDTEKFMESMMDAHSINPQKVCK